MKTLEELLSEVKLAFPIYWEQRRLVRGLPEFNPFPEVVRVDTNDPKAILGFLLVVRVNGKEIELTSPFEMHEEFEWDFTRSAPNRDLGLFANEFFAHLEEVMTSQGYDFWSWDHLRSNRTGRVLSRLQPR